MKRLAVSERLLNNDLNGYKMIWGGQVRICRILRVTEMYGAPAALVQASTHGQRVSPGDRLFVIVLFNASCLYRLQNHSWESCTISLFCFKRVSLLYNGKELYFQHFVKMNRKCYIVTCVSGQGINVHDSFAELFQGGFDMFVRYLRKLVEINPYVMVHGKCCFRPWSQCQKLHPLRC